MSPLDPHRHDPSAVAGPIPASGLRARISAVLALAAVTALCSPAVASSDEVAPEIRDHVAAGLDENGVPGAVLAIAGPEGTAVEAFGTTGRDDEPVHEQTPFLIGSVTKSFTAVAVLQLAERGAIDLDDPVADYLPWFSVEPADSIAEVTVRTLLNQTSGIPTDAGGGGLRYLDDGSVTEVAHELEGAPLSDRPGARFQYANGNYVLLGALIEEVSGLPFGDYIRAHILDPLGMDHTYTALSPAQAAGMSEGHRYWFGLTAAHTTFSDGLLPAGGLISTGPDMARYGRMLLSGGSLDGERILSREAVDELTAGAAAATVGPWAKDPDVEYGMGLYVGGAPFGSEEAIFHPGGSPDFAAMFALLPERERALVLLMNVTPEVQMPGAAGAIDRIGAGAVSMLMGEEPAEGTSMHTYYVFFDLIVMALVAGALWALVRALRRPPTVPRSRLRGVLGVVRCGLALLGGALLLLFPVLTGLGWGVAFLSVPDVALSSVVLGVLLVAVGLVHAVRLARARASEHRDGSPGPPSGELRDPVGARREALAGGGG